MRYLYISIPLTIAAVGVTSLIPNMYAFTTFVVIPYIMFYTFQRLAILLDGDDKKEIEKLNNFYMKFPNQVKNFILKLLSPFKLVVVFINNFLNWIISGYRYVINDIILNSYRWVVTNIKNAIISVIRYFSNYLKQIIRYLEDLYYWVVNTLVDYVIAVINFMFKFFFFNMQELLNKYLATAFSLFGFSFKVIKMHRSFFIF